MAGLVFFILILEVICAVLGASIAESKNRSAWAGALLGLFLGLLGVAIVALLSKLPEDTSAPAAPRKAARLQPPNRSASTQVRPGGAQARLDEVAAAVGKGAYGKAFAPMDYEADQADRRGDLEALEYLLGCARSIETAPDADPGDKRRAHEFVARLGQVASSFVEYTPTEPLVTDPPADPGAASPPETTGSPIDIVKERYARGEITREEFQQFAADLA